MVFFQVLDVIFLKKMTYTMIMIVPLTLVFKSYHWLTEKKAQEKKWLKIGNWIRFIDAFCVRSSMFEQKSHTNDLNRVWKERGKKNWDKKLPVEWDTVENYKDGQGFF
jgi:hypothetical protein